MEAPNGVERRVRRPKGVYNSTSDHIYDAREREALIPRLAAFSNWGADQAAARIDAVVAEAQRSGRRPGEAYERIRRALDDAELRRDEIEAIRLLGLGR